MLSLFSQVSYLRSCHRKQKNQSPKTPDLKSTLKSKTGKKILALQHDVLQGTASFRTNGDVPHLLPSFLKNNFTEI